MILSSQSAMQEPVISQQAMIDRVVRDASRMYGDTIDEATLVSWAQIAVTELWGESVRVTAFLPVLAMRQIDRRVAEFVAIEGA